MRRCAFVCGRRRWDCCEERRRYDDNYRCANATSPTALVLHLRARPVDRVCDGVQSSDPSPGCVDVQEVVHASPKATSTEAYRRHASVGATRQPVHGYGIVHQTIRSTRCPASHQSPVVDPSARRQAQPVETLMQTCMSYARQRAAGRPSPNHCAGEGAQAKPSLRLDW